MDSGQRHADAGGARDGRADSSQPFTWEMHSEAEPNGGNPLSEVNDLEAGWEVAGAIGNVGDVDVFSFATTAGRLYRLELEPAPGSTLDAHLTVLDSGRHDEGAGADYTKLTAEPPGPGASMEFVAFGAGHYVIVRDARNIGGATVGDASLTYRLRVRELSLVERTPRALFFPNLISEMLEEPGSVHIYPFQVAKDTDVRIQLDARSLATPSQMDSRLWIWAKDSGTWVARNDDGPKAPDSLIYAPLPVGGELYLLVENVEPTSPATDLRYRLNVSLP
ncbi:MAG: hypothetical protein KC416_06960 [Myxococcales bacterium]|nr:hypothetical protein [Myxococcales bacterium]